MIAVPDRVIATTVALHKAHLASQAIFVRYREACRTGDADLAQSLEVSRTKADAERDRAQMVHDAAIRASWPGDGT